MTTTIQQTSKPIKLTVFAGQFLLIVGLVMLFSDAQETVTRGVVTLLIGMIVWMIGKTLKWWKHE